MKTDHCPVSSEVRFMHAMLAIVLFPVVVLLTDCAGSFAWEDVHHSTRSERRQAVIDQQAAQEVQLRHQLADGSLSKAGYDRIEKENAEYLKTIQ